MAGESLDLQTLILKQKQETAEKCMMEVQEVLDKYGCFLDVEIKIGMNVEPIGGGCENQQILLAG